MLLDTTSSKQDVNRALTHVFTHFVNDPVQCISIAHRAMEWATQAGQRKVLADALMGKALCCRMLSDFHQSLQLSQEAGALYEMEGYGPGMAHALINRAYMLLHLEKYTESLGYAQSALRLIRQMDQDPLQGFVLLVNGMIQEHLGNYRNAFAFHCESWRLSRQRNDNLGQAEALLNLGILYRKLGATQAAIQFLLQSQEMFEQANVPFHVSASNLYLGKSYMDLDNPEQALYWFRKSLALQRTIGHSQGQGACHLNLGKAWALLGDHYLAEDHFLQSIEHARSFNKKIAESKAILHLAKSKLETGQRQQAIDLLHQVEMDLEGFPQPKLMAAVYFLLGQAYEQNGKLKCAVENYKKGSQLQATLNSDCEPLPDELPSYLDLQLQEKEGLFDSGNLWMPPMHREHLMHDGLQSLRNISHELRTPLMAIGGIAELLAQSDLSKEKKEMVAAIQQSSAILQELIEELAAIGQQFADPILLHPAPVCLDELTTVLANVFACMAKKKNVGFFVTHPDPLPPLVLADAKRIKQMLLPILDNAIKYTDQGQVHIAYRWQPHGKGQILVVWEIVDSGIGIAEEHLRQLFVPGYRVNASGHRGGQGLGLSLAQRLAFRMGGTIQVSSKLQEGSTFTVQLPVSLAQQGSVAS